jgi:hypothetical protein
VYHYLRDKRFLIKVPSSWRELHARGQKLLRLGAAAADFPEQLGVSAERWKEIVDACGQRVVAFEVGEEYGPKLGGGKKKKPLFRVSGPSARMRC